VGAKAAKGTAKEAWCHSLQKQELKGKTRCPREEAYVGAVENKDKDQQAP